MGTRTKDTTAAANRARTTVVMDVSHTFITAAALFDLGNAGQPNDCWAELGVMSGGQNQANRIAILAQGFTGPGSGVSWTGRLHLGNESFLYANLYSSSANTYRLSAVTGRAKPTDESDTGENNAQSI